MWYQAILGAFQRVSRTFQAVLGSSHRDASMDFRAFQEAFRWPKGCFSGGPREIPDRLRGVSGGRVAGDVRSISRGPREFQGYFRACKGVQVARSKKMPGDLRVGRVKGVPGDVKGAPGDSIRYHKITAAGSLAVVAGGSRGSYGHFERSQEF